MKLQGTILLLALVQLFGFPGSLHAQPVDPTTFPFVYQDFKSGERLYFDPKNLVGSDGHLSFGMRGCPSGYVCLTGPVQFYLPKDWKSRSSWEVDGLRFDMKGEWDFRILGRDLRGHVIVTRYEIFDLWYLFSERDGLLAISSHSPSRSTFYWLTSTCGVGASHCKP